MVARSRARYLAPIALVATLLAIYLVVHGALGDRHPAAASHSAQQLKGSRRRLALARFYTVRAGDNLTAIASKSGVSLRKLEELNPSADPNALQTGQRVRLR